MAEFHAPEGFLDALRVGSCLGSKNGVSCYELTHEATGQRFVLKHISLPASEDKLEALILSGAYADTAAANGYYQHLADDLIDEIRRNQALSDCPNILRFLRYRLEPKASGVGYDLYVVMPAYPSLQQYRGEHALTHLEAMNLGLDLCAALEAIHEAGFLFQNLRPENVFLAEGGRFLLGDFGLASMQDMQYSSLPEQYLSEYSAPELGGVLSGLNPTIDIYSLGMLLYRIYNGFHAPFEDEATGGAASEERRRAGEALPAPLYADYELAEILSKACAFRPEDRYPTPTALRMALTDYMRRNEISDQLIIPPIVSAAEPLLADVPEEAPEPVSFTDVEELDEEFRLHFKPDTASLEAVIEAARKEEVSPKPVPAPERAPEPAPEPEPPVEAPAPADEAAQDVPAEEPPAMRLPEEAPESEAEAQPEAESAVEYADTPDPVPAPAPAREKKSRKARAAEKRPKEKKKRHVGLIVLAAVLTLLVAAVLLYHFTDLGHNLYEYEYTVRALAVTDTTADSVTLQVISTAADGVLTLQCQDAYGDSVSKPVGSSPVTFDGLEPGRQYNFRLTVSGFHKLSGVTECSATTLPTTELLTFAAGLAPEENAAQLTLVVKDGCAEPAEWQVEVSAAGEQPRTQTFVGHSTVVGGLTVGKEYTFRLCNTPLCYLTGQTETVYTPLPQVTATDFSLDALYDGTATLRWRCVSELPEEWTVTCELPDGTLRTLSASEAAAREDGGYDCTASIDGIEVGTEYLFRLSAEGMYQDLTYTLPAELPYVSSLTAEVEDRAIVLNWESGYTPAGGWLLSIAPDGNADMALATSPLTETSYRLEYQNDSEQLTLLPNTAFTFMLLAADGTAVYGHTTVDARSKSPGSFDRLGLDIQVNYTGLYRTPTAEDWDYRDLLAAEPQTTFSKDDSIEILLRNRAQVSSSDNYANLMFVLRDGSGKLVDFYQGRQNWNDMWASRHWVSHLARTPKVPGSYRVEVYISYEHVHTFEFTITD